MGHVEVAPFYTCKKINQLISETEVQHLCLFAIYVRFICRYFKEMIHYFCPSFVTCWLRILRLLFKVFCFCFISIFVKRLSEHYTHVYVCVSPLCMSIINTKTWRFIFLGCSNQWAWRWWQTKGYEAITCPSFGSCSGWYMLLVVCFPLSYLIINTRLLTAVITLTFFKPDFVNSYSHYKKKNRY